MHPGPNWVRDVREGTRAVKVKVKSLLRIQSGVHNEQEVEEHNTVQGSSSAHSDEYTAVPALHSSSPGLRRASSSARSARSIHRAHSMDTGDTCAEVADIAKGESEEHAGLGKTHPTQSYPTSAHAHSRHTSTHGSSSSTGAKSVDPTQFTRLENDELLHSAREFCRCLQIVERYRQLPECLPWPCALIRQNNGNRCNGGVCGTRRHGSWGHEKTLLACPEELSDLHLAILLGHIAWVKAYNTTAGK